MTARFPVPETRLPGLVPLLGGRLWHELAEKRFVFPLTDVLAGIRFIRLKPSSSCRLVVFAEPPEPDAGPPPGFLLSLFPDADRAREAFEKERTRRHAAAAGGYHPFLCEEQALVAVPYPNDARLPGLRHLYRPHRMRLALEELLAADLGSDWRVRRSLVEKRLLGYKPGKRAVFRIDATLERRGSKEWIRIPLHLKVETPEACAPSHEKALALFGAAPTTATWGVPRPLGRVESRSWTAAEWFDGRPVSALLGDADTRTTVLADIGHALASFHALSVDLEAAPSPEEESRELSSLGDDLSLLLPSESARIRRLAGRLADAVAASVPGPLATVHGDFHLEQVLANGWRRMIVDVDRAGRGEAASDIGAFLAHLEETEAGGEALDSFLAGYRRTAEVPPDPDRIRLWTAAGLLRRTVVAFRRLHPDWPARVLRNVARSESWLDGKRR